MIDFYRDAAVNALGLGGKMITYSILL